MYECYAQNSVGEASSQVTIDVKPDPPVVRIAGEGEYNKTEQVSLSCIVTSGSQYGPMRYKWTFYSNRGQTVFPEGVNIIGNEVR